MKKLKYASRLKPGLRWTWRWKTFKRHVLMHNKGGVENVIIDVCAWLSIALMAIISFLPLVAARLAIWLVGPFIAPLVQKKPFFDMLERQLARDKHSEHTHLP